MQIKLVITNRLLNRSFLHAAAGEIPEMFQITHRQNCAVKTQTGEALGVSVTRSEGSKARLPKSHSQPSHLFPQSCNAAVSNTPVHFTTVISCKCVRLKKGNLIWKYEENALYMLPIVMLQREMRNYMNIGQTFAKNYNLLFLTIFLYQKPPRIENYVFILVSFYSSIAFLRTGGGKALTLQ